MEAMTGAAEWVVGPARGWLLLLIGLVAVALVLWAAGVLA